ncbi:MAG: hypothetical protein IPG63_15340 [Xanthomonadales bacterium]|nr:hypothetical protein [Xanthomonadales bacterium]
MNTADHLAALGRLYGPGAGELRNTVEAAAYALGESAGDFRTVAHIDAALATVEGLRRHLLRLRACMGEADGRA